MPEEREGGSVTKSTAHHIIEKLESALTMIRAEAMVSENTSVAFQMWAVTLQYGGTVDVLHTLAAAKVVADKYPGSTIHHLKEVL